MKIRSKKLLIVLLLLPVLYAFFLTTIGILYGTKETVFDAKHVYKLPLRGEKPFIFSVPVTYKNQAVFSYKAPKECYEENGECHRTGETYSYKYLRTLVEVKVSDKAKLKRYFDLISVYENIAKLEKINDFIPWDLWAAWGVLLAFQVVFRRRFVVSLLLWWWYALWAIIGNLGFYAVWRTGFSNTEEQLEDAFLLATASHHFAFFEMHMAYMLLILGIPVFFAVRAVFRMILRGIKTNFHAIENIVEFGQQEERLPSNRLNKGIYN